MLFKFDISQGPPKKFVPQGPRLRPGWALSSYATESEPAFNVYIMRNTFKTMFEYKGD